MLEPGSDRDIQKKYEKKCQKLQKDLFFLKEVLHELTLLPRGIYADLDEQISNLDLNLAKQKNWIHLQKNMELLRDSLSMHLITRQNSTKVIESRINKSFVTLLHHLTVPSELQSSLNNLEKILANQLENDTLLRLVEGLTNLLADSSQTEEAQFEDFFQVLTQQLQDFNHYISQVAQYQDKTAVDSRMLQLHIESHIAQIRDYLHKTMMVDDVLPTLMMNLENINQHIRTYKSHEEAREKEQQQAIQTLKAQLEKAHILADTLKTLMSAQHFKTNQDALTGLANRFNYEERIVEVINRSQRSHQVFSLVMLDIDNFQYVNDNYGHLAGDKILKKMAEIISDSIRVVDFLARYEEDKFVIILENTSKKNALSMMEKLCKLIQQARLYAVNNPVDITLSVGMAAFMEEDTPDSLFLRAKQALREAKNTGKNKVVMY